jgi:hypothetical protein
MILHGRSRTGMRITNERTREEDIVMEAAQRQRRGRWRRAKCRPKLQKAPKDSARKTIAPDEALHLEQADRLLLSALRYWEVERDLIEERLAAIRSAPVAS